MKRLIVLSTVAASLLLAGTIMPAAAADMVTKAPAASVADTWWVYHGDVEFGGRFFANDPNKNGLASLGQKSLGKYYEYSDIKPGVFGDGWLNGQTKDGLYNFDIWADNVGYNDQRYEAGVSKAGEYYFDIGWDQTPHIYSTNAQTLYSGLGGGALVLPPGLSNKLFGDAGCVRVAGQQPAGCASGNPTAAQRAAIQRDITNNLYTTDIGIRRDTAAVAFRWTPTDAWDINFNYSNMHRWGSQVEGVVFSPGTSGVAAQVPKPVNDTTQNFGVNGEYKGTSPWGKAFTFKLGYSGSIYEEAQDSYTVQNPFCATGSGPGECARNGSPSSPLALMTLWPNNSAHGLNSTFGADLPVNSRYMGTVSYTWMRQNDSFIPTISPLIFTNAGNTVLGAPPALPASSLNGSINTFLSNNVITTQITPEVKSKLSYRYYDYANDTPELRFNDWALTDVKSANITTGTYAPVSSMSVSYNKQNAGAELVWTPTRQWNLGAGYGYERYKWERESADVTHENSGKVFADYKPWSWLMARASWVVSDRHYDNYNYRGFANIQWSDPGCALDPQSGCNVQYSTAMRQFYLDNRQRNVGKFSVAVDVLRGLTVTPTFGYQEDNYSISPTEAGLSRSQSVKAGVEVAYAFNPYTTVLLAYMNEQYRQQIKFTTASGTAPLTAANTWHADVFDRVNTFMAAANWGAIPDKLDFRLSYAVTLSNNDQPIKADNGAQPAQGSGATTPAGTGGNFPDVRGQWSRLEALAKYTFDKDSVRMFGIHGQAYAKLRYVWERNSVNNYDQDIMTSYMDPLINNTGFMTWMAYNNPNYDVHLIGASLGVKW
jgi:MtrB/PioB family decaheme-associated outer membrane protein